MTVLPEICKTEYISLRGNLQKIIDANANFLLDNDLGKKIGLAQHCLSVRSGFQFANAFYFFNFVESYKDTANKTTFKFHSDVTEALLLFGYKKPANILEEYITFVQTCEMHEAIYNESDPTKAKSEDIQNQLENIDAQFKRCLEEIPISEQLEKINKFLKAKFVSQEEFDRYWLDQILQSETYLRISQADTGHHHLRKRRFENWQERVLKENDIEWQFDIWNAPMGNLDDHYYDYAQTNKGIVRLSSGRGMQKKFLIHSWPDLEVLVDIHKSDIPKTQKEIESDKGQIELNQMIEANQKIGKLEAKFGNFDTISEVIKACLPISMWRMGLVVGKLGASNKMLLKLPIITILAIGAAYFLWLFADIPSMIQKLIYGPYNWILTPLSIITIICNFILVCGIIWRCIFTVGLYLGTFKRAIYGFPITTNIPNTDHSNFITRLFGRK